MKPRQPYRSPFWRPDIADAPPRREIKPAPVEPRPPPPAPRAQHPATPQRLVPYAPGDLALFGKLMSYGDRREPSPVPQPAPTRQAPVARPRTSNTYTGRDAALFQGLEASFAGIAQPAATASAAPAGPSRGYTQADLAAFDKLTAFGR